METPVRLMLVDDHQILVQSLSKLLGNLPGLEVQHVVSSGEQALSQLAQFPVDVVVSDVDMPGGMDGFALTRTIKSRTPQTGVLLLSWSEDAGRIREAVQAGANGYLSKHVDSETLEKAIRIVAAGEQVYSSKLLMEAMRLPPDTREEERDRVLKLLTPRELEVLRLLVQDLPVTQIAERLHRTVATVETHRKNLKKKLNAKTMVQLMRVAIKLRLLDE
jgi:DNA-binding NarL/FixJ family response regulator